MEFLSNDIEVPNLRELIGTTVNVNPQRLINQKRLFTTQDWIDIKKLHNAVFGLPSLIEEPPSCHISFEDSHYVYTVTDGNHRLAIACINGIDIPLNVVDVRNTNQRRFGFNKIVRQVRSMMKSVDANDYIEI